MKLSFPNPSRSFDESKKRVRFWGYDRAIEVSFFVEADALQHLCPDMSNIETELLKAFDSSLSQIHAVADKVYERGGGGKGAYAYVLAAKDF